MSNKLSVHNLLFVILDSWSVYDLAQHGFPAPLSEWPYLWLTDSVVRSDHLRLVKEASVFDGLHRKVLICKVFLGKSSEMTDLINWLVTMC